MSVPVICPCCGYDLANDEAIERENLSMKPYGALVYFGRPIKLEAAETIILWSLLKAGGQHLSTSALHERLDSTSDGNIVNVYVCRLRKKLAFNGPSPIETLRKRGYRWVGP